jgi:hypothetical protein
MDMGPVTVADDVTPPQGSPEAGSEPTTAYLALTTSYFEVRARYTEILAMLKAARQASRDMVEASPDR